MKTRAIPYSDAEMAWLEAHRDMIISDYHSAFVSRFGRDDVRQAHLHGLRKRKGWKVGRAGGRYVGRHRRFSAEEIAWLSENRALVISQYHQAFVERFGRPDLSAANLNALRKRQGWRTGNTGRFTKETPSWNKGKTMPFNANSARTQFKKGQRPMNMNFIGHERVNGDGYVEISVNETNPHTGGDRRYVHKHRLLWEQEHGPVPAGHALKCLDGNKENTDPSNWEPIPRGVLARLNGGRFKRRLAFDAAPGELKPALMAIAKIEHAVHTLRKDQLS